MMGDEGGSRGQIVEGLVTIVRTWNLTLREVDMGQSLRTLWQSVFSGKLSSSSADVRKGCWKVHPKRRIQSFRSWTYLVLL